jgi:type VI secretion system lysozyme-like protein
MQLFQLEPRAKAMAPVPLWDRLSDPDCEGLTDRPARQYLTSEQLVDSVIRELSNLLDTRVNLRWDQYEELFTHTPLILPYGLPVLRSQRVVAGSRAWKIKRVLEATLSYFEPRLHQPNVTTHAFNLATQTLPITIQGQVWLRHQQELVTFQYALPVSPST